MPVQLGQPPQHYDARLFLFGEKVSLDRLTELVALVHGQAVTWEQEGPSAFPGPGIHAWLRYLFMQAANDKSFPYPARLQMWWGWASGHRVTGDPTAEVLERVAAEARQRGLSEGADAFGAFWSLPDVLAASAEAFDRWLIQAR